MRFLQVLAVLGAVFAQLPGVTLRTISDENAGKWRASVSYPQISGPGALARYASEQFETEAKNWLDEFLKQTKSDQEFGVPNGKPFRLNVEAEIMLNRPSIVSGYSDKIHYDGEREIRTYEPRTFAVIGGQCVRVRLSDLLRSKDASYRVSKSVIAKLRARKAQPLLPNLNDAQLDAFVVTPQGLLFLFEPLTMSSDETRSYRVLLPFPELAGLQPSPFLKSVQAGK
jgi:hypothetical protein